MQNWIQDYIQKQQKILTSFPAESVEKLIEIFQQAHKENRQIFVFGNGGSAANCSHFATDLGKGSSDALEKPFRILSLNDNTPWMTAIGNDYTYEDVFLRQLQNYGQPGDLAFTMSVSGNSPNLVKAFEWANANQLHTIALVGGKRGRLAEMAHTAVVIESEHYGRVEDAQMTIAHLICYAFMENL